MTDLASLTVTITAPADAVAVAGNDLLTIVGQAPFAGTVSSVKYVPNGTRAGAATHNRTLTLFNRNNTTGAGTTSVAALILASGVDLTDNVPKTITLSGTPANLVVAEGDVLEWSSVHNSNGIVDPGGLVVIEIDRS